VLALPLERIRSVSFKNAPASKYPSETFRNLLTLDFAWPEALPRRDIEVGMAYAPTFAFKGMVDPMALQQTVAQLGDYFDSRSASGLAMSNAIMAQVGGREDRFRDEERRNQSPDAGPEVESSEADQDLYVFTVRRVTLKKGERMVLPVAEYELGYRDVYVLDLPFAPPMEVRANANDAQQQRLARLLGAPHFVHVLRLTNSGHEPLTTACSADERVTWLPTVRSTTM
jgi:hypothetical protein